MAVENKLTGGEKQYIVSWSMLKDYNPKTAATCSDHAINDLQVSVRLECLVAGQYQGVHYIL